MKRCPACERVYTDETLNFCRDDGAPLVSDSAPTKIFPSKPMQSNAAQQSHLRASSRRTRSRKARNSLAILPLTNASNDASMEYLSDGITESIIDNLSQLPGLRVMARSTVFSYKGKEINPQEAGRELGVRAVLTGRVLQLNERLIIKTELVDVADGWQLWGEKYDRTHSDIFAVQEEIANEIAEALRLKLSGAQMKRLGKRHTENSKAYQMYLKGRYFWNKRTEEGLKKSIEYFELAILSDADYALAHAGLADCYNVLGFYSALPPSEAFSKAKLAAIKALEIENTLAEAYASLAYALSHYDWEWAAAEQKYQRALELNPNYATAHQWYGWYFALLGRFPEGISEMKQAQERDPLSLVINSAMGWVFYLARDYDQAVGQYRKTLEMDPNFYLAHLWLGRAYEQKGEYAEAISELQKAKMLADTPETLSALGHVYAISSRRGDAIKILNELTELTRRRYVSPYFMATVYAGLDDKDQAFLWLERACEERSFGLVYLKVDPILDVLRADSRFTELLRRIGLTSTN